MTIENIHVPINWTLKYRRKKLTELQVEIDKPEV